MLRPKVNDDDEYRTGNPTATGDFCSSTDVNSMPSIPRRIDCAAALSMPKMRAAVKSSRVRMKIFFIAVFVLSYYIRFCHSMSRMSRRGAVRSPSSVRMSENIRSEQSRASASDVTGRPFTYP